MSLPLPPNSSESPLGGRYKVISHLGAGGFGQTFLAEDLHLPGHPTCVVKQLKPEITNDHTLQMARRCFNTEAEVLYQLGVHEQIPRLLAHFEENKEFYLAQEFIAGDSLIHELPEGKSWPEAAVIDLLKDILHVLSFVHQQHVIHRDIKPSNLIRRQQDKRIELIDFGAVKQVGTQGAIDPDTGLTNVTISIGTKGYMPNEQLAGKPRFSSDVYAVGILGIQALAGIHPRHLEEDSEGEIAWHYRASQVSTGLAAVLDRMVRYDFRERYRDATEALEALTVLEKQPGASRPSTRSQDVPTVLQSLTRLQAQSSNPQMAVSFSNGSNGNGSKSKVTNGSSKLESDEDSPPTAIWVTAEAERGTAIDRSNIATYAVGRPRPTSTTHASGHHASSDIDAPPRRKKIWMVLGAIATLGSGYTVTQSFFPNWTEQFFNPAQTPGAAAQPSKALKPDEQAIAYLKQANAKMQAGFSAESLKFYDQALALKPDSPEANAGRCEALNMLNRPDEALVSCYDALNYKPGYPQALWSQANALFRQDKKIQALKLYEDVTERKPEFAPGWVKRAVTLQTLGRSAEALQAVEKAISLHRNSAEAWATKGEALLTLQRYEDAIISFNKALQIQPKNAKFIKLRDQAKALQSQ